jgi:hypothetical protein
MIDYANATVRSAPVFSTHRPHYYQSTASHQLWPFESSIFWPACALYVSFQFKFYAALFRALFVLSLLPFLPVSQLFREQVLRAQPYVQLSSNFFFYCFSCLFLSCNRLLQFFICRRTLSLTFYLFQRGCTFSRPSNFDRTEK